MASCSRACRRARAVGDRLRRRPGHQPRRARARRRARPGSARPRSCARSRARRRGARPAAGACDALRHAAPARAARRHRRRPAASWPRSSPSGATPGDVVAALRRELRRDAPTIVVLEDLHWADEATLDVLRLLGRRIETVPALVARHLPRRRARRARIRCGSCSASCRAAVERLDARRRCRADAVASSRPAGAASTPTSCTAAPAATRSSSPRCSRPARRGCPDDRARRGAGPRRAARRRRARRCSTPSRSSRRGVELWLLGRGRDDVATRSTSAWRPACCAPSATRSPSATSSRASRSRRRSRPHRRIALHRRALGALSRRARGPRAPRPPRRGAPATPRRCCATRPPPASGPPRSARTARRPRSTPARCATPTAAAARRAELLERRSYECYLTDDIEEAIAARAARRWRAPPRAATGCARATRTAGCRAWPGSRATTPPPRPQAARAVELLEPLPAGRELAMAYSNLVAAADARATTAPARVRWGERAIALAERLGETEILVHALNNVGAGRARRDGARRPREARAQPRAGARAPASRSTSRAPTPTSAPVRGRACASTRVADAHLAAGHRLLPRARPRRVALYMLGWRARSAARAGRWDAAARRAAGRARPPGRGRAEPDHAARRARPPARAPRRPRRRGRRSTRRSSWRAATGELQRLAPVAGARAEARWLAGEAGAVAAETAERARAGARPRQPWAAGELRWLAPARGPPRPRWPRAVPPSSPAPRGAPPRWTRSAARTRRRSRRLDRGDEAALRAARSTRCSGSAPRRRGACRARAARAGVRDVRRGPARGDAREPGRADRARARGARAGRRGPAQRRDRRAAVRLARRTVDHHVSAILRKLGVRTPRRGGRRGRPPGPARKIGSPADVARAAAAYVAVASLTHEPLRDPAPQRLAPLAPSSKRPPAAR